MQKNLEKMSPAELGRLFPIIITEYNEEWPNQYQAEKMMLEEVIGLSNIIRIEHYGSTSIPSMCAKPTIDILLEVQEHVDLDELIKKFRSMGYNYSYQPGNAPPHMMFMKGYTSEGYKGQTYHVHVRYRGDWDELYFRDYLIRHPEISVKYGELKRSLQEQFVFDREAYTRSKTEFIKKVTREARLALGQRY